MTGITNRRGVVGRQGKQGRSAFTLIELLLVMVIIAILAAIVVPKFVGRAEQANHTRAVADLSAIKTALEAFEVDNQRFPTTEEGLGALSTNPASLPNWHKYLDKAPIDPWGSPYVYRCPGTGGSDYDLLSSGKDKQEGTADDVKP